MYSEKVKLIVSIILGLGMASLFRQVCKGRNCIILNGPNIEEIEKNTYKYKEKCYKYKHVDTTCKIK